MSSLTFKGDPKEKSQTLLTGRAFSLNTQSAAVFQLICGQVDCQKLISESCKDMALSDALSHLAVNVLEIITRPASKARCKCILCHEPTISCCWQRENQDGCASRSSDSPSLRSSTRPANEARHKSILRHEATFFCSWQRANQNGCTLRSSDLKQKTKTKVLLLHKY